MKVNIYLETDKQSQECMQRKYGYVIETIFKGTPITREGFGSIEGTYHKTNLQALIKALGHFHKECEVCVYTRDAFVATRILKTDDMMAAGFKDTKGKPIKNAQEWEKACKKLQECKITISSQTGKRYKDHIASMTLDEAKRMLNVPVIWFKYKENYLSPEDWLNGKKMPGFYAEDIYSIFPEAAQLNEKGEPEDWNFRVLIPVMLKLIQNLYEEKEKTA